MKNTTSFEKFMNLVTNPWLIATITVFVALGYYGKYINETEAMIITEYTQEQLMERNKTFRLRLNQGR